jgi:hypothetical protein
MKPYPHTATHFDHESYIERQLETQQPEIADHGDGVSSMTFSSDGLDPEDRKQVDRYAQFRHERHRSRFRGWAIRLNYRIEDLMERFDWRKLDRVLSNICAITFTGAVLWLLYVLADAWMRGAFNLGGAQ